MFPLTRTCGISEILSKSMPPMKLIHSHAGMIRFGGKGWILPVYFTRLTTHAMVCRTSRQSPGRSLRCQPLGLRLQAEGGCGSDPRSCMAHTIEEPSQRAGFAKQNFDKSRAFLIYRDSGFA
jgi:hypothetical protein